jgi:murein DD-endopeptidase MepM/ murein hydrolase activator NlpD
VKFKAQDSKFKTQGLFRCHLSRKAAIYHLLRGAAICYLLSACSAPIASSNPSLGPTQFLQTRVPQVLTQNAMTDIALSGQTPLTPSLTPLPLPTPGATMTSLPSVETRPNATPCGDQACAAAEHFWLERPIPAGHVNYPDRTYPYGSTAQGQREPHHGVEFFNPSGTPVIAAATGTVVVAGDDLETAYGPARYFYGNLVVVQLDQPDNGQPVFTLYGHLQNVAVSPGQRVSTGEVLGYVGYTGVALGPHLHFEVRVGQNDYASTRNPELWLKPLWPDWGAIAGRVTDTEGKLVEGFPVVIRPESANARAQYITTYAHDEYQLKGDDILQENFAIGDMPAGTYTVSVNTTTVYRQTVTVTPGRLTWMTFVVNPPLPTATP